MRTEADHATHAANGAGSRNGRLPVVSEVDPWASSRARAWLALVLGLASVLTMPASIVVAQRSPRIDLLDAAYGIPVAFVLGVLATGMARRAKRNLEWLRLNGRGSGVARVALVVGILGLALAAVCALSIGVYEGVLYYQRHYR